MADYEINNQQAVAGDADVKGTSGADTVVVDVNVDSKMYDPPRIDTGEGQDVVTVVDGDVNIHTGGDNDLVYFQKGDMYVSLGNGNDTISVGEGVSGHVNLGDGDDVVNLTPDEVSQNISLGVHTETVDTITGFQPVPAGLEGEYASFADTITFGGSSLFGLIEVPPVEVATGTVPESGALVMFFNQKSNEDDGYGVSGSAVVFPDIQASEVAGVNVVESYEDGGNVTLQVLGK